MEVQFGASIRQVHAKRSISGIKGRESSVACLTKACDLIRLTFLRLLVSYDRCKNGDVVQYEPM